MAHFAKLDENSIVVFVTVGSQDDDGKELMLSKRTNETYRQTSYNTHGGIYYTPHTSVADSDQSKAFRKNYAGIGFTYDSQRDAFIPPKNYLSWKLNEFTCLWEPPISYPDDGKSYYWDESTLSWILVE